MRECIYTFILQILLLKKINLIRLYYYTILDFKNLPQITLSARILIHVAWSGTGALSHYKIVKTYFICFTI